MKLCSGSVLHTVRRHAAAKARKMLGWEPRHTMEEAIAETVDWYRGVLSFGGAATPR